MKALSFSIVIFLALAANCESQYGMDSTRHIPVITHPAVRADTSIGVAVISPPDSVALRVIVSMSLDSMSRRAGMVYIPVTSNMPRSTMSREEETDYSALVIFGGAGVFLCVFYFLVIFPQREKRRRPTRLDRMMGYQRRLDNCSTQLDKTIEKLDHHNFRDVE